MKRVIIEKETEFRKDYSPMSNQKTNLIGGLLLAGLAIGGLILVVLVLVACTMG